MEEVKTLEISVPETIEPYSVEISVEDSGPPISFYNEELLPRYLKELVES